ncbi:MAG: hypothetical protein HOW73_36315 [Polyangiaceae bacterium]|nr:hypothetical protein [Polyangiaceae bacterium]
MNLASNRKRLLLKLAATAAAAAALFPTEAQAQPQEVSGGAGLYVSFTFGEDRLGVGYGLEGHFMGLIEGDAWDCSSGERGGVGGLFQIGGINDDTFRFVTAAQGGAEVDDKDSVGLVGELGMTGHYNGEIDFGIHTGFLVQMPFFMTMFARAEWLLDEYSVGGGARAPHTFGMPGMCVDGRPLRDDRGVVRLPKAARAHDRRVAGTASNVAADDAAWLADAWSTDAQSEAASVPAFLQLAAELLANGAPDTLVEAALGAARDEIAHARACAAMATRYAGARVRPVLPATTPRPTFRGRDGVTRLAVESWLDGCLSEGAAAERARASSSSSQCGRARRVHGAIAIDEARHAELGWLVLRWALRCGGSEVADAVRELRNATIAFDEGDVPSGAERMGQLKPAAVERLHARHARRAVHRLDSVLAG